MVAYNMFFTNVSYTGCINVNGNQTITGSSINVMHDKSTVLISVEGIGVEHLVPTNYTSRISNYTTDRSKGYISFCIINTTFKDGGDYNFSVSSANYSEIARLYVLGKPLKANLSIESHGIVDSKPAQLLCRTESTSSPLGLPLTYIWMVNSTIIVESSKYAYKNTSKEELFIQVSRNDQFNKYQCSAKEDYGQTSDFSDIERIDPKVSPIVTLLPGVGLNYVVESTRLVIKCVILAAYPNVNSYQWFRNNSLINESSDELVINKITKYDNFIFLCSASNGLGINGSASINLTVLHGPVIRPMPYIYQEEGTRIQMICDIESYPAATDRNVTWRKIGNSTFSYNGLQLLMASVNRADDGTFACTVNLTLIPTNGSAVEKSASAYTQINVFYGPSISTMAAVAQEEGKSINITCNITSNPKALDRDVTWTKQGNVTFRYIGLWLFIESVSRGDKGKFNCSVTIRMNITNGNSVTRSASENTEIDILYGPVIAPMTPIYEEEGKHIQISCNIDSNPIATDQNVTWSKIGNATFIYTGLQMLIASLNRADNGTFVCTASLTLKPTNGVAVEKSASSDTQINVFYGPVITTMGAITQEEDKSINVTCYIMSNPKASDPDVTWTKQGNVTFRHTGLWLFIKSVDRRDKGTFNCSVTINMNVTNGYTVKRSASANTEINILYQATVVALNSTEISDNNSSNLTCTVAGNPLPNISWIYLETNTVLNETYSIHNSEDSSSSILEFMPRKCQNTGTYQCLANNDIKSSSSRTVNVTVLCSPQMIIKNADGRNLTISKEQSLNFTTWFYAFPRPTFEWYFNQSSISSNLSDFKTSTLTNVLPYVFGSKLEKNEMSSDNIGTYLLITKNSAGHIIETFHIDFQREPNKPELLPGVCNPNANEAEIYWKSGWNGGAPQTFDILYKTNRADNYTKGNFHIDDDNNFGMYSYVVANLLSNQIYIFKVLSINSIGSVDSDGEFNCTMRDAKAEEGDSSKIIGATTGSVIVGLSICVGVILFIQKRKTNIKDKEIELLNNRVSENSGQDDDLKDNICYISADQVLQGHSGAEYSVVQKKHSNASKQHTNKDETKKKGDVYENVCKNEDVQNTAFSKSKTNMKGNMQKKHKDGLIYADLQFQSTIEDRIHGKENRTEYVDIDFTKKAEPLPSDDSEDENNLKKQETDDKDPINE